MNWLDVVLLIWLIMSLVSGAHSGFIYVAGRAIGLIIGFWAAIQWTVPIANWFGGGVSAMIVVFLIILTLISRLFGGIVWAIDKAVNLLSFIPFLKTFNRVFGGLLSFFLATVMASVFLYIVVSLPTTGQLPQDINDSPTAQFLLRLSNTYDVFLSDSVEDMSTGVEDALEQEVEAEESVQEESELTEE